MTRWEYCEVANRAGKVEIRRLTTDAEGLLVTELASRDTHNMAVALAQLGLEGWEVVDIRLTDRWTSYTKATAAIVDIGRAVAVNSWAFLKRPIAE